jgi:5-methylcytosine-specific restriction endonuclease McrBC GTP-binding regulatory subunit McrB
MFNRKNISFDIEELGFKNVANIFWNAATPHLYEERAKKLVFDFQEKFRPFENDVPAEVKAVPL